MEKKKKKGNVKKSENSPCSKNPHLCNDNPCLYPISYGFTNEIIFQKTESTEIPNEQEKFINLQVKRNVLVITKGYLNEARKARDMGFTTFSVIARRLYEKNIMKFLNFYIKKYDNDFAKQFKNIINLHIIESKRDFEERNRVITEGLENEHNKNKFGSFILYRILNKERQIVRIGYTANAVEYRLTSYFGRAFNKPDKKRDSQFHLDIRDLGDVRKFNDKFEFQILCIADNKGEIKIFERLFTIYENRYDNELGYDLSINDYYNRIIGDWGDYTEGTFKDSKVHPMMKVVPPESLKDAVKDCSTWNEILARFDSFNTAGIQDPMTIKKKAIKYGFTIKRTGSKKDVRAFFLKPLLEKLVLKKILDPDEIFIHLKREGFHFLNNLGIEVWAKQDFLRKIINYIWRSDMDRIINFQKGQWLLTGLRKLLIYNKTIILMRNPRNNIVSKAQNELIKQGIPLRLKTKKSAKQPQYDGELLKIFTSLNKSYKSEQNKILAAILTPLLIQENPDLSLGDIANVFGLVNTVQNRKLIENMINRIFKEYVQPLVNVRQIKLYLRNQL
ncbi:hypothetical protein LCGC14_0758550 [marine sediment metagenome]|uniref:Uncharacterized protein n=1 Tax=marine sediment metagenome TaxID=412755 RepID=A0A0F9T913_9ZZZZ